MKTLKDQLREVTDSLAIAVSDRDKLIAQREELTPVYKWNYSLNSKIGGKTTRIKRLKKNRARIITEIIRKERWT